MWDETALLWERAKVLRSVPVAVLVIIAALDSADKALLAASFPMLETTLGLHGMLPWIMHPLSLLDTLGYFSLFTNLSYALSLPFWGWLVHRYTVQNAHNILCMSCFLWGAATLAIARSETILAQAFYRSINGGALASILPLSQMMLVDLVPSTVRGSAFGLMGFLEKIAATLATSAVIWYTDWRAPYFVVGSMSILMALSAKRYLRMKTKVKSDETSSGGELSLLDIFKRISQVPSFAYLVAQGVFGAIPWDMMSFVLLLLEWKDFTREQIISFSVAGGIFGTVGAFLGGVLGDYFAHLPDGRVNVALFSVLSGILSYGLFLYSESYVCCILFYSMFHLTGGWCPAAALRPLCADLAQNQSERAQIVAFWVLLEKTSSAIFGAPLVGFLTRRLLDEKQISTNREKARVLGTNIFLLSTFFWGVCAYFFTLMGRAECDRKRSLHEEDRKEKKCMPSLV